MSDPRARPILMSAWEIRALLDRGKTQARKRVSTGHYTDGLRGYSPTGQLVDYHGNGRSLGLKYAHDERGLWHKSDNPDGRSARVLPCPFGRPGDLLYVKETIERVYPGTNRYLARYRADGELCRLAYFKAVTAANHTYRHDGRLTLELTDVRVQRVQEISCADAIAEGIPPAANSLTIDCDTPDPRRGFRSLWDSLNAVRGYPWKSNPFVWALSFVVHRQNVDALIEERRHAA